MKLSYIKKRKFFENRFQELLNYDSLLIKQFNNNPKITQTISLPKYLRKIGFFNLDFFVNENKNEIEINFSYNTDKFNVDFLKKIKNKMWFYNINPFKNNKIIFKNISLENNSFKETIYNKVKINEILFKEDLNNSFKKVVIKLKYKNIVNNFSQLNSYFNISKYNSFKEVEKYNNLLKEFEHDETLYKTNES